MKYQLAHYSLRGGRPTNQDRTAVAERDNAVLLVLGDGLGGHRGGEIAAETLCDTFVRAFQNVRHAEIANPSAFLALTILQAHKLIVERGETHQPPIEPRTTCVVCLVQKGYAYWAHVGDSRLYHYRLNKLLTRTEDHTTTEQLRRDGLISEEEMSSHPSKGHLLKCLGGPNRPSISVAEETLLLRGDHLLLCSDGLWEALKPEEIEEHLRVKSLDEALEEMLLDAERRMGESSDNLSAVALRWEDHKARALPVQGNPPLQVDEQNIWRGIGKRKSGQPPQTEQNVERSAKSSRRKRNSSLEQRIQELEDYINKFEPK